MTSIHHPLVRCGSAVALLWALAAPATHAALVGVDAGSTLVPTAEALTGWADTGPAQAPDADAAPEERAYALSASTSVLTARLQATANAIGSRTAPTASTFSLWAFITAVRAQQSGERFFVLESQASVLALAEGPAAPVPLPAAAWMLVMGVAGWAGVRWAGLRGQPTTAAA